jgi:hypothetical protein
MSSGAAWAVNEATYNAGTGVVNMPKVSVGAAYYNVDMSQQGPGLDFLVTAASPATSTSSENIATYNANNRTLHIPTVIVGADRYTADLAQIGEGYYFSVTSATLAPVTATPGRIPDTGQTTSYIAAFGEDHDYTINPPSYAVHGNGTVTDNTTGLMWQQLTEFSGDTWETKSYCDNLVLAGYSDWRRPTINELVNIVNYEHFSPAIDSSAFPNTEPHYYWSDTTSWYGSSHYQWYVDFQIGTAYYITGLNDSSLSLYVRCVRDGQ